MKVPKALTNSTYCVEETPLRWEVTKQRMDIDAEGFVHVPEGPGLGVDLDEDIIEKYRVGSARES